MKLKRKNGLTIGIIALSAVAITSVGFASWIISAGDTAVIAGNIEVDDVADDSHTILGVYDKTAIDSGSPGSVKKMSDYAGANRNKSLQSIQYGAPATNNTAGWLTYKSGTKSFTESLGAEFYVCVDNGSVSAGSLSVANYIKAGIEVVEKTPSAAGSGIAELSGSGFAGAKDLGLVALPSIKVCAASSSEASTIEGKTEDTEEGVRTWFKVKVEFSWGSKFNFTPSDYSDSQTYKLGSMVKYSTKYYICTTAITTAEDWNSNKWTEITIGNPYYYYNNMLSNETIADDANLGSVIASTHANKYLSALEAMLNGVSYKFTFKSYANKEEKDANTDFATSGLRVVADTEVTF